MMSNDRHDRVREIDSFENLRTDDGVDLHLLELGGGEFAGLVENVIRHGDLADIVQQCPGVERLDFQIVQPEVLRETGCIHLDPVNVIVSNFVLGVDSSRKRFNSSEVKPAYSFGRLGALFRLFEVEMTCSKDYSYQRNCSQEGADTVANHREVD